MVSCDDIDLIILVLINWLEHKPNMHQEINEKKKKEYKNLWSDFMPTSWVGATRKVDYNRRRWIIRQVLVPKTHLDTQHPQIQEQEFLNFTIIKSSCSRVCDCRVLGELFISSVIINFLVISTYGPMHKAESHETSAGIVIKARLAWWSIGWPSDLAMGPNQFLCWTG